MSSVHRNIAHYLDACSVPREHGRTRRLLVPTKIVNTLTQMRFAGDDLEELLASMLDKGQLYHGIAGALTEAEAEAYLAGINEVHNTKHRVEDLVPIRESARSSTTLYIILVAGERRYNACCLGTARIQSGELSPTVYFDGRYHVELRFGLSLDEALDIQATENTYRPPRPREEASFHWHSWRYRRAKIPDLTVAQYARKVGRSPAWMHSALRFAELPECLQQLADKTKKDGGLPYMTLVELGRYFETVTLMGKAVSEEKLQGMATFLWAKQLNPKEVREFISIAILQASGQAPQLFEVVEFGTDQAADLTSRTASLKLSRQTHADLEYFQGVLALARAGHFRGHHPLAPRRGLSADSAHHAVAHLMETATEVVAQLGSHGAKRHKQIQEVAGVVLPQAVQTLLALEPEGARVAG